MNKEFVFRKDIKIGAPDAEADKEFIRTCFVDTGELNLLLNTEAHECIILGRTGAGKSALIEYLRLKTENVIQIEPENLALSYISNSTILRFFEALGVDLDLFYKMLWTHILVVELIKYRYKIKDENSKRNFIERLYEYLDTDPGRAKALSYFEDWGNKFWLETETRIKELTDRMESELRDAAKVSGGPLSFDIGAIDKLTSEVKSEIVYNARNIVNKVQIKELNRVIVLLADYAFADPQHKYYLVIDRLDEKWVDDQLRYKLIRALIETIKSLKKLNTVKIIIAIRQDLLWRVFENTKDSGFQLEKYENYFLKVRWTENQLRNLVSLRINHALKGKYTKSEIQFFDIFPYNIDAVPSDEYLLRRTLLRPRDVIVFINECFRKADGKTEITPQIIKDAETSYSNKRLRSLVDEWYVDYPLLDKYVDFLRGRNHSFQVKDLDEASVSAFICLLYEQNHPTDPLMRSAEKWMADKTKQQDFVHDWLEALYRTGCIGIKYDGQSPVLYPQTNDEILVRHRIQLTSHVYVQRMLWAELKVNHAHSRG